MARHALFTIVENILRNSAKHNKHNGNLVLTIRIAENNSNDKYIIDFYDNCKSATTNVHAIRKNETENVLAGEKQNPIFEEKTVIEVIREKLNNIIIIGEDAKIDIA